MGLPNLYFRAALEFSNPDTGAFASSVLWYLPESAGSTPTQATIGAYATSFKTAFTAAVQAALPTSCVFNGVNAKYVNGGVECEGFSTGAGVAGTVDGDCLPEEDVLCIQRRTGQRGRNKRGRIFFPFVPEDFATSGKLTPAGETAALALANMVKNTVVHSGQNWKPQTPDWKTGVLVPVIQGGYVQSTCSRRDRRFPKILVAVHTA